MNELNSNTDMDDFKNKIAKHQLCNDQKKSLHLTVDFLMFRENKCKVLLDLPNTFKDLLIKIPRDKYNCNLIVDNYKAKVKFLNNLVDCERNKSISLILNVINVINNEDDIKIAIINLINDFN